MRIVILTQEDPFFLPTSISYLLDSLPAHACVAGSVLLSASPFGQKKTFAEKLRDSFHIFGAGFVAFYGGLHLIKRLLRSPSVKSVFNSRGIPVLHVSGSINDQGTLEEIRRLLPDVLVSVSANQIFKKPLLDLAPMGCLNLHASLLPRYRGLMPSFWALRFSEPVTGVSVFQVDSGIDSGPILVQKSLPVGNLSLHDLIRKSKLLGMDAIIEAIGKLHVGDSSVISNDNDGMTYFGFPTKEDVTAFLKAGKKFY